MPYKPNKKPVEQHQLDMWKAMQPKKKPPRKIDATRLLEMIAERERSINDLDSHKWFSDHPEF